MLPTFYVCMFDLGRMGEADPCCAPWAHFLIFDKSFFQENLDFTTF